MKKLLIFILIIYSASLLYPKKVMAQCFAEPATISENDLCTQFDNNIYNQLKVKVAKDFLNNYVDAINRISPVINPLCYFSSGATYPPSVTIDTTSDPNFVIYSFPGSTGCTTQLSDSDNSPKVIIKYNPPGVTWQLVDLCQVQFSILPSSTSCNVTVLPVSGIGDVNSEWNIHIDNIIPVQNQCVDQQYTINYPDATGNSTKTDRRYINLTDPYDRNIGKINAGSYSVVVTNDNGRTMCSTNFNVGPNGATPLPTFTPVPPTAPPVPTPTYDPTQPTWTPVPPLPSLAPICDQLDPQYSGKCWDCMNRGRIWTAIGCIPIDINAFVQDYLLVIGTGMAGGVSFLYFLYGVFLFLTSSGNAEIIAKAKEIIISAISGLLLIIFSVFLLKIIGVDILRLPGFS